MRIAVLGAGNGGQATAADLTLRGHEVELFDRYAEVVAPFASSRTIELSGAIGGSAHLKGVSSDIQSAVADAEVIIITLPGFALSWIASELGPHLVDGQIVVLHPGGTGGALEVRQIWTRSGITAEVTLAETETLAYACRATSPGVVDVKAIKRQLWLAALPGAATPAALEAFARLYPQTTPVPNVLATSLANMNAVIHPAVALMSASLIDRGSPSFSFYGDGVTRSVAGVLEAVDGERCALALALGAVHESCQEWIESHYGVIADDMPARFEQLARDVYQGIGTPDSMEARYVSEDVPMALVPMEQLGALAGVPTPTISALVTLCSAANSADYRESGRTLERLGLAAGDRRDFAEQLESLLESAVA